MAENIFKPQFNPFNWLKIQLKNYLIRYHDYPPEKYVSVFIKNIIRDLIRILEQIIFFGVVSYFFLFGLMMVFQKLHSIIWLGTMYLETILVIFLLGLIVLSIKQSLVGYYNIRGKK